MANYDVGTLLLDLQVYGQAEFEQNMGRIEQGIEDADAAGVSFFRNNKQGYGALKSLVINAADSVDKLTRSYEEGRISSSEYAEGLAVIDRINTAAVRSSGTLKKSVVDVSAALASVRQAGDSYEAVFDRAIGQTERLFAAIAAGKVSANEAARALSDARREVMNFSGSLDETSDEASRTYDLATALGAAMTDLSNGTRVDGLAEQLREIREGALAARDAVESVGDAAPSFDWDESNAEDYAYEVDRAIELLEEAEEQVENRIRLERELGDEIEENNRKAAQAPERRIDPDANPFGDERPDVSGYELPVEETERYSESQRELGAQVRETTEALREQRQVGRTTPPAPPAPPRNNTPPSGGGGDDDRNRKPPVTDVPDETLAKLKEYENRLTIIDAMHRAGQTPTRQFKAQLDDLGAEALQAATRMDRLSDEYVKYVSVAGRAGAIKNRLDDAALKESYFSRQFILGNALSNVYGELAIRVIDFVSRGVGAMDDMAVATERAQDGQQRLIQTAQQTGTSYAQVRADVDATAQKYMILASNAEGAASTLLEAGYSSEQVGQLLDAVGATAVQRGQDVREAFAQIAAGGDDIEGALTTATGATEGYERALLRAAAGQANMVGNLAQADRQAALLTAVMSSASDALRDYGQNTDGIVGAQMRQQAAAELFRREMGEEFAPTVERVTQLGTQFIQMAVSMVGPIAAAADGVSRLAGSFNQMEVMLIAIAVGGPRAVTVIGQLAAWMPKLAVGARAVLAAFGGWPALLATVAAVTFGLVANTDTAVQRLEASLDKVGDASASAGAAFDTLKAATDKEGLQGAVSALASTMDTEAAQAFTDFADDAIESAETTVGAIDAIYMYLADKRRSAIEGALADIEPVIAQLQDQQAGNEMFAGNGGDERLEQLQAEKAELEAIRTEIENLPPLEALERQMELTDVTNQLSLIDQQMASLATTRAALGGVDNEQAVQNEQQLAELLQRRRTLTQELNVLTATPRQAVDRYFRKGSESGEGGEEDPFGPVEDPFQDARDSLNVARAAYNNLKTEMDLGDAGFGEVSAGAQNLLGSLDTLIGKMQALNASGNLAADQQVELYNLAGERARLVAEINESPNVEREQNAGSWIERLTGEAERGQKTFGAVASQLASAKRDLQAEMDDYPGFDVMTDEQAARL